MAVIALGKPIKTNLDGEHGAMAYIINPAKTDGGRLVSSNYEETGTDWHLLAQPMIDDNLRSPRGIRKDSRLAYHIKMSFSPDDPVTPELVHRLGVEFARRITGGDYKFVVATHTDRHHLHNHIMICAAARDAPHLKAELPKDIIGQWRETSDMICRREGLSVIARPAGRSTANRDPDPTPDEWEGPDASRPQSMETTDGSNESEIGEPTGPRGYSMAELYATLKGLGVKDRIRTGVDVFAARAESFDDLVDMLGINDIHVELRGSHLTYEYRPTGFRIRDSKLGQAYSLENVMARVGDSPVVPITFNRHLIARQTKRTVTVWLPGTKRRKRITLPRTSVVMNGSTCRAFLPVDRRQPVTDRSGRFVEHVTSPGLYQWFGMPQSHVVPLVRMEHLPVEAGASVGQRHYYAAQARQLDALADRVNALNAAVRWRKAAGGDANEGLRLLRESVNETHANLQAAVIALNDAIANGDTDAEVEARSEVEARELMADHYDGELASIERALKQTRSDEQEQAQRREQQRRNTRRGRHF